MKKKIFRKNIFLKSHLQGTQAVRSSISATLAVQKAAENFSF